MHQSGIGGADSGNAGNAQKPKPKRNSGGLSEFYGTEPLPNHRESESERKLKPSKMKRQISSGKTRDSAAGSARSNSKTSY